MRKCIPNHDKCQTKFHNPKMQIVTNWKRSWASSQVGLHYWSGHQFQCSAIELLKRIPRVRMPSETPKDLRRIYCGFAFWLSNQRTWSPSTIVEQMKRFFVRLFDDPFSVARRSPVVCLSVASPITYVNFVQSTHHHHHHHQRTTHH